MEKSTTLARLALFSIVCCFIFPLSSCTQDEQEEELYIIEAKANSQRNTDKSSDQNEEEEEKKEDDFVDKKNIKLPKKKNSNKSNA